MRSQVAAPAVKTSANKYRLQCRQSQVGVARRVCAAIAGPMGSAWLEMEPEALVLLLGQARAVGQASRDHRRVHSRGHSIRVLANVEDRSYNSPAPPFEEPSFEAI